jgi:cellobiose phosphorylase
MNLPNGSESCFTACLYGKALLEMIAISKFRDDSQSVFRLQKAYEDMKASFQQSAWDGEWFISYFDQTGAPIGSHTNTYGQIYAYTQAWPVIAGFATPEQTNIALESVHQKLNTRNGVKLSTPGFNGFDPKIGGTSTYPPGAKENGGIFLHVNPWVILAETLNGNAERAYRYYAQINPASKNDKIDEYEVEPYVYAQNILADEHPLFGLGRNSWLSGTASWMMQVGVQAILGVRASLDGLVINPCIPSAWDQFEVSRVFRGVRYQIHIQNPKHVSKGVDSLKVNGNIISGNVVPMQKNGPVHVEVVLG